MSGGPHASHVLTRPQRCWKVPEGLDATQAVYFHLASIALQGMRKSRLELGEPTLALGLGLIGNLAQLVTRYRKVGLVLQGHDRAIFVAGPNGAFKYNLCTRSIVADPLDQRGNIERMFSQFCDDHLSLQLVELREATHQ